jgi:hypothetical protein
MTYLITVWPGVEDEQDEIGRREGNIIASGLANAHRKKINILCNQ